MKLTKSISLLLFALIPASGLAIGFPDPLAIPDGHRQKLNSPLGNNREVVLSGSTPDSSTVVYISNQDDEDAYELYSVRLDGGEVTKLSDTLVENGHVVHFEISPDSSTVVYVADQDTDGIYELYSVPVDGGVPSRIHVPLQLFGTEGVGNFRISPDGSMVLFTADFDPSAETYALYRAPIAGGDIMQVAGPLAEGREFGDFRISPDGNTVIYLADENIAGRPGLYSVSIDGGTAIQISGSDAPFGDGVERFDISPDGSTVVYVKESFSTDLYSVSIDGGASTRINDRLFSGPGPFAISDVDNFAISPDSSTVVYQSDETTDNVDEIYAVPIEGGSPLRLNGALGPDGDVRSFTISPDGSTVVYLADQDDDNVIELYSVSIMGGADTKLNPALASGGDVKSFQLSGDSSSVIYHADQDDNGVHELYHVPTGGGVSTKINAPLAIGGDVPSFFFSPLPPFHVTGDSTTVVYLADQDTDGIVELYAVWIREEASGPTLGAGLAEDWLETHFRNEELANPWLEETLWGWDADPDGEGLSNLMEYALGGDPHIPSHQFSDGSLMGASLEIDGNIAIARFPNRSDAFFRGLDYSLEFSSDLENWSTIPPGFPLITDSGYAPSVPGFQQTAWRWNASTERIFVRLRVSFETLLLL